VRWQAVVKAAGIKIDVLALPLLQRNAAGAVS
jgi:hypothetical protein